MELLPRVVLRLCRGCCGKAVFQVVLGSCQGYAEIVLRLSRGCDAVRPRLCEAYAKVMPR